jgi:hypothetical protein
MTIQCIARYRNQLRVKYSQWQAIIFRKCTMLINKVIKIADHHAAESVQKRLKPILPLVKS